MLTESKTFQEAERIAKDPPWHPRSQSGPGSTALTALVNVFCAGFILGGVLICLFTVWEVLAGR